MGNVILLGQKLVILGALFGAVGLSYGLYSLVDHLPAPSGTNLMDSSEVIDDQNTSPSFSNGLVCGVSQKYPDNILQWCEEITKYASEFNLSPDLVAAVILQESGGKPLAYSHSGAVGLMQVMPRDGLAASFMCKNGPCFQDRPTIEQLKDPLFNIHYGTRMLAKLLQRNGNIREALKAYGPMDVGYYYADIVLSHYQRYGN